ncbi:isoprenyl transferase [Rhodobium gokarnense]|uniref:Isoprenyl transferase n=1 Tax=Rhodobium gokarnense TaxID=364296 RepID=A0ABT3HB40_9HYPH|nr:isoprenyl transferase [Rhodobium gokarnense]MCW2307611.1 undecaprenyl diphosphate synthase [Rhodobium gokarnense]
MTVRLEASTLPLELPGDDLGPSHVAIIMDGNGRWASARGLPRTEGHRRGVEAVRKTVRYARERGIDYLTLFSFSSENWSRPPAEIAELMLLLRLFIRSDLADLNRKNVRVRIIGTRDRLNPDLRRLLHDAETTTRTNTGMTLVIAFNYGARDEIVRAVQRIAAAVAAGEMSPDAIDQTALTAALDTRDVPDPDLIIRTSGEQRLSNFLLWQAAYSEFVFVPTYWPDFDETAFGAALAEFYARDRRFGGVEARARPR